MHQQVLLSRGRIAVGRLQTLVLCVKVRHGDSSLSLTKYPNPLLQTREQQWRFTFTFTCAHLVDTFIQSELQVKDVSQECEL